MADSPVIYIFHGDDENAMHEVVQGMQSKLGDAATAAMNTTHLEGAALTPDALRNAVMAMPFLAKRRLVVAKGAGKAFSSEATRKLFLDILDQAPASTALVLLENPSLVDKKKSKHWLLKWSENTKERAFVQAHDLPQSHQMRAWIRDKARHLGAEMLPDAAEELEKLVGNNKEAAVLEVEKLLAYTAYSRPIEKSDVGTVSSPIGEKGDFFALVDSITGGNSARAMDLLEKLLLEQEHIILFFSLVGHFRLLLQAKELVETGRGDVDIAKELGIHPYRAEKLAAQARRFSQNALDSIYRRLVDLDLQIKTGEIEADLAMETFVASFSAQAV